VVRSARDGATEEIAMRDDADIDDESTADDVDKTANPGAGVDSTGRGDDRDHVDMDDVDELPHEHWRDQDVADEFEPEPEPEWRYRPGRGGFDPDAAYLAARAKYGFRQRVVLAMLLLAVISALVAGFALAAVWWAHGVLDLALVCYLGYLRRQVRIEEEIRQRRFARMAQARRAHARAAARVAAEPEAEPAPMPHREPAPRASAPPRINRPGAVVVEVDDEDPAFDELDEPGSLPYRRAAGE